MGTANYWLSYALLIVAAACLWAPYGPYFAFITEVLPRNVAAGALGLINSFGALGSFAGTYLVGALNASSGGPALSYLLMASGLVVAAVLTMLVQVPARETPMKASSGDRMRPQAACCSMVATPASLVCLMSRGSAGSKRRPRCTVERLSHTTRSLTRHTCE